MRFFKYLMIGKQEKIVKKRGQTSKNYLKSVSIKATKPKLNFNKRKKNFFRTKKRILFFVADTKQQIDETKRKIVAMFKGHCLFKNQIVLNVKATVGFSVTKIDTLI